ncbi:Protein of unknown function [Pseudomonas syringae]|nr:Protein of unknown function [Pseudomonas syringae]
MRSSPDTYRSSRSSVGTPWVTLCVTNLRRAAYSGPDAERPERHADAKRRTIVRLSFRALQPRRLSFLTLQPRNALGDALRHKSAPRRVFRTGRRASRTACDAERRTIVEIIVPRSSPDTYRSSRSSVGMPWVTLCVTNLRRAAYSGPDAGRPERHADAERRTIVTRGVNPAPASSTGNATI